jgi:hypothetical protein
MTNPNENEREKILDRIIRIKEDIWEAREYINSDYCKKCSEIYSQILRLEQELEGLQRKLEKDERA